GSGEPMGDGAPEAPAAPELAAPEQLFAQARLRDYKARRSSSWDRTGGNGDFFGLGLGEYYTFQSALLAVAPVKALNAYFQMPFANSARLTLTNEGKVRTDDLYFAIDYVAVPSLPPNLGRFH